MRAPMLGGNVSSQSLLARATASARRGAAVDCVRDARTPWRVHRHGCFFYPLKGFTLVPLRRRLQIAAEGCVLRLRDEQVSLGMDSLTRSARERQPFDETERVVPWLRWWL